MDRPAAVWMDQGGTFTDVVRMRADGTLEVEKHLSDRVDLAALGAGADDVRRGTTIATNALLERKGVPVLLVVTRGFGDLPWIGDGTRPDLFALRIERPPSLATQVLEIDGRIDADGKEIEPHVIPELPRGFESAAVVLVHGPLAPEIEDRIARALRDAGFAHVSVGHEVAPSRGFLERMHTTLADAALTPLLPRAPGLYLRSDGGLSRDDEFRGRDAVLSGPAGGVIATAQLARHAGLDQAFGLDMGGTSTDVCRVAGEPGRRDNIRIGGLSLRVPAVELDTIAAGGGSILRVRVGTYEVGPASAGADPGPAAYGRGGPATLTDVEAVLGRLPMFPSICGPDRDRPLDVAAARRALQALDPTRPVEAIAMGFREVAAETTARAVRRLAASLGIDPRAHGLVAFGGAGPAHACAIAERLGIGTVVVPFLAGAFSAVGIGAATRRAVVVAPVVRCDVARAVADAEARLPFAGSVTARLACRFVGTSTILEVALEDHENDFHRAHRERFGFDRAGEIEALEVRLTVEELSPVRALRIPPLARERIAVRAWFDGAYRDLQVGPMDEAHSVEGPALFFGNGTTVVVDRGWIADARAGFLLLRRAVERRTSLGTDFHPVHTAVFATRVAAIAEQMGERLQSLARSTSIRERRDFSCAVFDRDANLCANAPHVPVHLGAMGETVRRLAREQSLAAGEVWVTNDPYAGGSHLPDITVVRPVFAHGERIAFVACRGHHVDVGGITPGSMPPFSTRIEEEGFVLHAHRLVAGGVVIEPDLPTCREPAVVLADLLAQAAACEIGNERLSELEREVGPDAFAAQLDHLRDRARRAVLEALGPLAGHHVAEETLDDGTRLAVELEIASGHARIAIRGPAHGGNLNAPAAVARAAVLYVLRLLVKDDLPLNEGALEPLEIAIEPGGLFDPRPPRAVAGGNVETSQRLVDALLRAIGALAASQGTMNNLTVGTSRGAWYETIGGGAGAGPTFDGASAVQVHMTNTRATDVEELETRYPVRLERFARWRGSGGRGRHDGGDGIEKVWQFLEPADVSLLAGRRNAGAPGLAGGGAGRPGVDEHDLGRGFEKAPPRWRAEPGHRLRIRTPGGGGFGPPSDDPTSPSGK